MPPRRRGKAATARAAAIEAVQQKKKHAELNTTPSDDDDQEDIMSNYEDEQEEYHHPNINNQHHHHSSCSHHNHNHDHHSCSGARGKAKTTTKYGKKKKISHDNNKSSNNVGDADLESELGDGLDGDSPPPLVDTPLVDSDDDDEDDEEYCDNGSCDGEDDDAVGSAEGAAGANSSSNTMSGEGGCLHCHKSASNADIQVRCDECQAYICQTCHWCHEFQANHEIRVCDRCDAFYCRTCDEMDQCDDCGEVVCASCSTLLSCKFCGGGLCEECATACGRCGIVLCSRDAKFAVDCDTCRLSYCLVCLASGSKDPCVRCGHRPSKRMEQLVHLRLKSIYKAFKQSSRNNKYGAGGGDDVEEDDEDDMEDDDNDDDNFDGSGTAGDPQSLLQAAASAASKHSGGGRSTSGSRHHGSHHHPSLHHSGSVTSGGTSKRPCSEGNTVSRDQQAKDMVDKYMVEKEKADAAAAALLAELEEEEVAVQSKKNKKQRKKEREKAKKEEEQRQQQPAREFSKEQNQGDRNDESMDDRKDDDSDIEIVDIAKASSTTKHKKKKKKKDKSPENWREEVKVKNDDPVESADTKSAPSEATQVSMHEDGPKVDPIEQQLCEYVADSNFVGIEEILSTLKGVPGRAVLRKNAKKALKKIKAEQIAIEEEATALVEAERAKKQSAEEETRRKESEKAVKDHHTRATSGAGTPATHSETNSSNGRHPVPPPLPPNELLRVVSHTQGGTGAIHASSHRAQRGQTSGSAVASSAVKAECVMHLAYNVVGWVIGKGGQRIRDLMEDSGAKVWIDQEHLSPTDPRIVYVSGNRKSVEAAVKMVKELVSKAPGAPAVSTDLTGSVPAAAAIPPSHLPPTVKAASAGESDSLPLAPTAPQAAHAVGTNVGHNPFEHMTMISPGTGQNGQAGGAPSDSFLLNSDDSGNLNQRTASDQHQHLGKPTNRAENFAQEISCEACFVPLLIGRRGWTIKHIQDSSGARVDIDQTVTPRKVKISGGEQNVQSAIRMVRDVLSYPHSQLQGAGDSLEGFDHAPGVLNNEREIRATATSMDPTAATLSNTTTVAVSNQMLTPSVHQSPILTTKSATVERVHTPPPSSHINISDAKSTISASSSLSSTPEPSMASTVKGHYGVTVGTPGPLLPPDFSGSYAQIHPNLPSSNLFGQQNSLQQMNLPSLPDQRAGAVVGNLQPQQSTHFPNGIPPAASMSPVSPRYISSGLQHGFSQQQQQHQQQHHLQQQQRQQQRQHELLQQQQQQQQQQHLAANMRQMNGLGGIPQQGPSYPLDVHATLHHSTSMPYSAGLSRQQQQNQTLLHQQSAFHPSDQKSMRVGSVPDIGMGHSSNAPTFAPAGMWGDGAGAGTGQAKSSNSADRFASSSLPLQGQQRGGDLPLNSTSQQQILGFGRGVIGSSQDPVLSGGLGGSAVPALKPQGKDDAQLIDSLFGPKHGGATKKDNILTGFQGLSLDEGLASDLWGKDVPQPWNTIPQGSSSLLASMQPDVNHPSQSRFGWGEKEGGGN